MEINLNGKLGGTTIVSHEDYETVSQFKWNRDKFNVVQATKNGNSYKLHRFIMNSPQGKIVDHINGNKLDNRRENLRITDAKGNSQNRMIKGGGTSKYVGVWVKKDGKYVVKIGVNMRRIHIGCFNNEIDAAEARDIYIVQKLPDSLFKLNFPEKIEEYRTKEFKFIENREFPKILKISSHYEEIPNVVKLLIPTNYEVSVLIDKEDYDKIKFFTYFIGRGYVKTTKHLLHRFIMDVQDPQVYVDHINNIKTDCRKINLRLSNPKLNSQNKSKSANTTSKYIGVSYIKAKRRWKSCIHVNGKTTHIGHFEDEKEAALARDNYILKNLPNSHYSLNFSNQ